MKKLFLLVLCINFLSLPAYGLITDDFAEKTLGKDLKIKKVKKVTIKDEFADKTLDKELQIKNKQIKTITDSFAEKNNGKNPKINNKIEYNEIIPSAKKLSAKKIVIIDESKMQPVTVNIKKYFTTRQNADEGDYIEFETVNNIKINNKIYPAGTVVLARVETISKNKSVGVPSDLVIGNFSIDGIPLAGEISKTGANRALWVRPCAAAFLLFFGAGLLFLPIRGGHAKIYPSQIYTLYAK